MAAPLNTAGEVFLPAVDELRLYGAQLTYTHDNELNVSFTPDMAAQRVLDLHAEMTEGRAR